MSRLFRMILAGAPADRPAASCHREQRQGDRLRPGRASSIGSGRQRPDPAEPVGDDGVTLNLVNLPISQAAKIVIGDIIGADFVVDPKLDGKVTVHTAKSRAQKSRPSTCSSPRCACPARLSSSPATSTRSFPPIRRPSPARSSPANSPAAGRRTPLGETAQGCPASLCLGVRDETRARTDRRAWLHRARRRRPQHVDAQRLGAGHRHADRRDQHVRHRHDDAACPSRSCPCAAATRTCSPTISRMFSARNAKGRWAA